MKKISFLIIATLLAFTQVYSQSQRLVLLEEFTQASCGPCAGTNPGTQAILNANPDKITSIWYHTSWPGVDPMNAQNPGDVAARVSLYQVTGVPNSVLDGNYYNGYPTGWNINTVNTLYAVPSPFDLKVRTVESAGHDSVFLTMVAKATLAVTGNMVAHNVVIEKNIHFNTPPGTNGEKDFPHVMKKMLPSKTGTILPTSFGQGDYVIIETAWKYANVYDKSQIAAVGFIQNTGTKEIHQCCNSTTNALTMPYDDDVQVMTIDHIPFASCTGSITPVVKVRNNGNHTLTTVHIKYKVDNGPESNYTWNGSLATLGKVTLTLPAITFSSGLQPNTLKVYTDSPNGVADQYPKNDTVSSLIDLPKNTGNAIYLFLYTDTKPQETTWDVKNASGTVIKSGGPYATGAHIYKDTINLPAPDCYTFTMYDAGGNGMFGENGNGAYQLTDNQGIQIRQGGTFLTEDITEFRLDYPTGVQNSNGANTIAVYPNPFTSSATVTFYLSSPESVKLNVMNTVGLTVRSIDMGTLPSGQHEYSLQRDNLAPGVYFLQLRSGSKVSVRKVTVF
jgi:hypothetical protein